MTTLKCYQPDGRADTISMTGPVESRVKIDGTWCVLRTWTRAQWDLLGPGERPALAWPHGDLIASLGTAD